MILSAQSIRHRCVAVVEPYVAPLIFPFCERTVSPGGLTFGLSPAGYDVRIHDKVTVYPGRFLLMATMEKFHLPLDLVMTIRDKSTWARRGVVLQNTVAEPGWRGYLTLEISNHSTERVFIAAGEPIAQVMFELLDHPTEQPYQGRYQNQETGPHPARFEKTP